MARKGRRLRGCRIPVTLGLGIVLAAWACAGAGVRARADRITLRGGGQIRGKVVPDPANPGRITILTESGKTPLSFEKAKILQVSPEPSALDEYVVRRDALASTAAAHHELGLWCEEHKLKDLAQIHFETAVKLDRSYEPAHLKLGHVQVGDQWLWGDDLREAQGLVRHKGQWISQQEKDQRMAAEASSAEQASWVRRLKLLRQSLLSGSEESRRNAETQLLEIRDPIAVGPLLQVLGNENPALRTLLDHILAMIPGPEASSALVKHILFEPDFDVRHVTIDELARRKDPNVITGLVQGLGRKEPSVVNRAAWSLGQLNAVSTVPKLIPALVSVQYQIIMPPINGSSEGNIGASFGSVAPSSGLGGSYFNSGGSYGLLTPPAVGPGVVAYGASAIPVPTLPSTGFSVGGGGSSGPRNTFPRIVPIRYQNVEVLATLVKLTGQDFGFDIPSWQRWVARGFRPDPTPVRSVPQP